MSIRKKIAYFFVLAFAFSILLLTTSAKLEAKEIVAKEFKADGVIFNMVYVPVPNSGLTFPTGVKDEGSATVEKAYWIGETEVTYELWSKVKTWAEKHNYKFANIGGIGAYVKNGVVPMDKKDFPAIEFNWRDAMIWTNALTEWTNSCLLYTSPSPRD